ncbi:MAG: AAA family ATPase [Acidobacteriota bacterium]|nr:AAA family ATPase [Acidobacteriota bacterium]
MSLSCAVRDRAARRVRLDGNQFETLACVLDNDVVLVRGGAGTGKTLLARELALREAGAGRSVLLLTYTEALGFELAAELEGRGIAVRPVARFALDRLRRRGFNEGQDFGRDEWKIADEHRRQPGLRSAEDGCWEAGAGEG